MQYRIFIGLLGLIMASAAPCALADEEIIRAGILGCDTSHVVAFTDLINHPEASGSLARVEVTVAFPGGSPDLPASRDRLAGFVAKLRERGVTIVDSTEALVAQCDVILLESVDGRVHLEQFREIANGKPVFIDKPAAASLADVISIYRLADATGTPVFSSSSLRFVDSVRELADENTIGEVLGCETVGPLHIEPSHPDLFWYGVHGVEALFSLMGQGCETVTRVDSDLSSLVIGQWSDGRLGSYRGTKLGGANYAFTMFGAKGVAQRKGASGYEPLIRQICEFFITGKPPVNREETFEIFAFMEAADESKRRGGEPVAIAEVMQQADREAAGRQGALETPAGR